MALLFICFASSYIWWIGSFSPKMLKDRTFLFMKQFNVQAKESTKEVFDTRQNINVINHFLLSWALGAYTGISAYIDYEEVVFQGCL